MVATSGVQAQQSTALLGSHVDRNAPQPVHCASTLTALSQNMVVPLSPCGLSLRARQLCCAERAHGGCTEPCHRLLDSVKSRTGRRYGACTLSAPAQLQAKSGGSTPDGGTRPAATQTAHALALSALQTSSQGT